MTYRINGTGTTISPMPICGGISIAMMWFTFFFIPLIPLGWRLVHAEESNFMSQKYVILKRLTHQEVKKSLGTKGMLLTVAYSYACGIGVMLLFSIFILLCQLR